MQNVDFLLANCQRCAGHANEKPFRAERFFVARVKRRRGSRSGDSIHRWGSTTDRGRSRTGSRSCAAGTSGGAGRSGASTSGGAGRRRRRRRRLRLRRRRAGIAGIGRAGDNSPPNRRWPEVPRGDSGVRPKYVTSFVAGEGFFYIICLHWARSAGAGVDGFSGRGGRVKVAAGGTLGA